MLCDLAWNVAGFLSTGVRVAVVEQLARVFCHGDGAAAREVLNKLEAARWVGSASVLIPELLPLDAPLFTWRGTPPVPNAGRISWILEKRVRDLPVVTKQVWFATVRGARRFGGFGGFRVPHQCWHDLMLMACYERLALLVPDLRGRWISEDCYKRDFPGRPAPDGLILDVEGKPSIAIDVGGPSYSANRLQSFHEDFRCLAGYQIW